MNRLGGSLLPAIIVHGLANDAMGIAGLATVERALTPDHQLTKAAPFLALALLITLRSGRQLGLPETSAPDKSAPDKSAPDTRARGR